MSKSCYFTVQINGFFFIWCMRTRVVKMFVEPAECVVLRTVPIACRTLALELTLHTCQR
jgi:hypothetical protein